MPRPDQQSIPLLGFAVMTGFFSTTATLVVLHLLAAIVMIPALTRSLGGGRR